MNKAGLFRFFLILSTLLFLVGSVQAVDKYWVAFNGTGGVYKYLMQIDQNGNITIPAKAVLSYKLTDFTFGIGGKKGEPADPFGDPGGENVDNDNAAGPKGPLDGPCAIALSDNGADTINYFILTSQGSLFRYFVSKSTLTPTTKMPIAIRARAKATTTVDFRTLQATQHTSARFLVSNYGDIGTDTGSGSFDNIHGRLSGFGLDSSTKFDGTITRLSPRTEGHSKTGSVSSDGLMAISNAEVSTFDDDSGGPPAVRDNDFEDRIYAQPLNATGKPVGLPSVAGITGDEVGPVDVSNPLSGGVRYLVYMSRHLDFPDTANGDDLVLQKIDAVTGAKIGGKHLLQQNIESLTAFIQGVAVDPDGRFVLFVKRPVNSLPACPGSGCGSVIGSNPNIDSLQVGNRDSLYYIAVDANGNPSGNPILLFSADDGWQTGADDERIDGPEGNKKTRVAGSCAECAIPQINGIDILKD